MALLLSRLTVLKGSFKNIQIQSEESGSELMSGRRECIILSGPIKRSKDED